MYSAKTCNRNNSLILLLANVDLPGGLVIFLHCSYRHNDTDVEYDNNCDIGGNEEGNVQSYGENTTMGC